MRHLTAQALLDHIENKEVDDAAAVAGHLESCSRCQTKVAELRELLAFLREDRSNEPPEEIVRWGVGLFQPVLRPSESRRTTIRRIAKRVFDSFEHGVPAGTRQVGVSARQLLYRVDDVDVDVRIEPGPDERRISLVGQVVSKSDRKFRNAAVELESDGLVRYRTETNQIGEFSFDEVPEGTYHLSVNLPDGPVTLFCVHRAEGTLRS